MKHVAFTLITLAYCATGNTQWVGHSRPNPNSSSGHIATDGTHLYCSAGGIYRSTDGLNWTAQDNDLYFVSMVFAGNDRIYATGGGGVISSADNGVTWSLDTLGMGTIFYRGIYYHSTSGKVFVGSATSNNRLYYKDAAAGLGTPWTVLDNTAGFQNAVDAVTSIGDTLFAVTTGGIARIYQSTDQGLTWTDINPAGFDQVMGTNPGYHGNGDSGFRGFISVNNTLFILMSNGLYKSTDYGATFVHSDTGLPIDTVSTIPLLRVTYLHYDGGTLYAGGGGMGRETFRSSDMGATWEDMGKAIASNMGTMVNRRVDAFALLNGNLYGASSLPADSIFIFGAPTTSITETNVPGISIYPNPAQEQITIEGFEIGATLTLRDISGRTIFKTQASDSEYRLNLTEVSSGSYILEILNAGITSVHKVIVQPN
jgi:hypothetical protein